MTCFPKKKVYEAVITFNSSYGDDESQTLLSYNTVCNRNTFTTHSKQNLPDIVKRYYSIVTTDGTCLPEQSIYRHEFWISRGISWSGKHFFAKPVCSSQKTSVRGIHMWMWCSLTHWLRYTKRQNVTGLSWNVIKKDIGWMVHTEHAHWHQYNTLRNNLSRGSS